MNSKERDAAGWASIEQLPTFAAWVCDPFTHINGSRYRAALLQPEFRSGLVWVVYVVTLNETPREERRSRGAFYDGAEDHPEGAVAWGTAWALEHLRKTYGASVEI